MTVGKNKKVYKGIYTQVHLNHIQNILKVGAPQMMKISSGSIYNLLVADLPSFVQRYIIRYLTYLHSSGYILLSSEKFFILQENDAAHD